MKIIKWFLFLLLIGMLFLCLFKFGMWRASYTQADEKPTISHQQLVYIHTLEFCESRGRENLKILDSNNRYSFGVLMFQMETFLREGKKYGLIPQDLTSSEAETSKMIYDVELQESIAYQMLLSGGERNWWTCWTTKLHKMKFPLQ